MTPIQQMFLGVGAKNKTYIDDLFSTFLYKGTASRPPITINNGINLAGEGGLVWIKARTQNGYNNRLIDTVRGAGKSLRSNTSSNEANQATGVRAFNSNGFELGGPGSTQVDSEYGDANDFASWTFRKTPGFFTICEWTGNGSNRTISHDLGSVPGMILIKNYESDNSWNWRVYHCSTGATKFLQLNSSNAEGNDNGAIFNSSQPTASVFGVGTDETVNKNGDKYVAYVFAGGDPVGYGSVSITSDASATTGNRLITNSSSDFAFGTDPFTIECWFKIDGTTGAYNTLLTTRQNQSDNGGAGWSLITSGNNLSFFDGSFVFSSVPINAADGNWHHVAIVRESTSTSGIKLWHNGAIVQSRTCNKNFTRSVIGIGDTVVGQAEALWGQISNVRLTKNQAIYTSGFTPSTTPLTTTSQGADANKVKLLCCNDIKIKNFTKSSAGLIPFGSGTVGQSASPFTAPSSYNASRIFGENEDQETIKCGSYVGNGANSGAVIDGPKVNLGWEPSWVLIKASTVSEKWTLFDNMRPNSGGFLSYSSPNENEVESTNNFLELNSTGFQIKIQNHQINANNETYIYIAIRRPDPLVQKPAKLGTGVFAMDTGNSSSTIPAFDSGFPVDFGIKRSPASTGDWNVTTRLTGLKVVKTNTTDAESTSTTFVYDSNVGWAKSQDSNDQGWMWKRHAGFDVVNYTGNGLFGHKIAHSLNKTVEMMWVKRRNSTGDWWVYHKGLDGGTNPETHYLNLNSTVGEGDSDAIWADTAPTSTNFTLGNFTHVNGNGSTMLAMLFASVDGISKVGSYTGNGSSQTITVGFQPRFLLLKVASTTEKWYVIDTTRGWGVGNDKFLMLNNNSGQSVSEFGQPTSTGFTVDGSDNWDNANGETYIYYAHA